MGTENKCELLDAKRYRRLQILGCAPYGHETLEKGLVLRFTNLDKFIDEDIKHHPSRGEARATDNKVVSESLEQTIFNIIWSMGEELTISQTDKIVAEILKALIASTQPPTSLPDNKEVGEKEALKGGRWINADDVDKLVRQIDIALNGDNAARQAKLCDIASQICREAKSLAMQKAGQRKK